MKLLLSSTPIQKSGRVSLFLSPPSASKNRAFELAAANRRILEQQAALGKSEVGFRTAFKQAFQFMSILDAVGRIIEMNELALELCDSNAGPVSHMYLWDAWQFLGENKKTRWKKAYLKQPGESVPARRLSA